MTEKFMDLRRDEQVRFQLRNLFRRYGYSHYKVNKFEEYDFYAENRNFLASKDILTFSDTDGKLMALKPDVTMSIIKNAKDMGGALQKLYYDESVYRTAPDSKCFRELVQTGLECIGEVTDYDRSETVMLACESLNTIHENYILDLSHIGVIGGVLDQGGLEGELRARAVNAIKRKNRSELEACCDQAPRGQEIKETLVRLAQVYGPISETYQVVASIQQNERTQQACAELQAVMESLKEIGMADKVYLDFSLVNSADYYSGILMQGFVEGLPSPVLQGGQYDTLVHRMGKDASAIGFAVYLDQLERLPRERNDYDVDILLLDEPGGTFVATMQAVKMLTANGSTVRVDRKIMPGLRYKQLLGFRNGGVVILESHD